MELFIRLSQCFYFYHIKEPLMRYYATSGSTSSDRSSAVTARKMILDKYYDCIQGDRTVLANHYFGIGFDLSYIGNTKRGRKYFIKALRNNPFNPSILAALLVSMLGHRVYYTFLTIFRTIKYPFVKKNRDTPDFTDD